VLDGEQESIGSADFAHLAAFADLDWSDVKQHYSARVGVHKKLLELRAQTSFRVYLNLMLGIGEKNEHGNYSARDHDLGPRILSECDPTKLVKFSDELKRVKDPLSVPQIIQSARIKYLKIGVGSEISCMLNPRVCWVSNVRTIWCHLLIKHRGSIDRANEELKLYREHDDRAEMAYRQWHAIHNELGRSMDVLNAFGADCATKADIVPGKIKYIWADAVANAMYASRNDIEG
jgi:hypothetical protein